MGYSWSSAKVFPIMGRVRPDARKRANKEITRCLSLRQLPGIGSAPGGQGRVCGERSERSLDAPGALPKNRSRSDARS
jgi:hypothetical protein